MSHYQLAAACAAILSFCPATFAGDTGPPLTGSDDCATPHAIAGSGTFVVDMIGATTSFVMPGCIFFFPESDVWFAWTPSTTGTATISLCAGANADTQLAVYANSPCDGLGTTLACNDNFAACSPRSQVSLAVTSGTTYIIQVGVFKELGPLTSMDISIQGVTPPTKYCRGDGTGADCPCFNSGASGRGCANSSTTNGASLEFDGTPSVSADTFALISVETPPTAPVLFIQGTAQVNGGLGAAFGDGLNCVNGTRIRLGTKIAFAGLAAYPGGSTPISVKGAVSAGDLRFYQAHYRDAPTFCTADTFNSTNGVRVTWAP